MIGQLWVLPPSGEEIDELLPRLENNLNVPLRLFSSALWNTDQPADAALLIALGGALSYELDH